MTDVLDEGREDEWGTRDLECKDCGRNERTGLTMDLQSPGDLVSS